MCSKKGGQTAQRGTMVECRRRMHRVLPSSHRTLALSPRVLPCVSDLAHAALSGKCAVHMTQLCCLWRDAPWLEQGSHCRRWRRDCCRRRLHGHSPRRGSTAYVATGGCRGSVWIARRCDVDGGTCTVCAAPCRRSHRAHGPQHRVQRPVCCHRGGCRGFVARTVGVHHWCATQATPRLRCRCITAQGRGDAVVVLGSLHCYYACSTALLKIEVNYSSTRRTDNGTFC